MVGGDLKDLLEGRNIKVLNPKFLLLFFITPQPRVE